MSLSPVERDSIQGSNLLGTQTSIRRSLLGVCLLTCALLFGTGLAIGGIDRTGATLGGFSLLVALTAFSVSGLLGFLFGVPRGGVYFSKSEAIVEAGAKAETPPESSTATDERAANVFVSNSNLIEVSDWLTKILVGLGLMQLPNIPSALHGLGEWLAKAYRSGLPGSTTSLEDLTVTMAICIVIFFACMGFIIGYLETQLWLFGKHSLGAWDIKRPSKAPGGALEYAPILPSTAQSAMPSVTVRSQ
jgi:hypothetical protein